MSDWGETKAILNELEQLFNRSNDISDIIDVKKMAKEIEIHRESNLRNAKELIKGLTNTVSIKENEIIAPSEITHSKKIQQLAVEKENANRQYESLRSVIDSKRERVKALAEKRLEEASNITTAPSEHASDPRSTYILSLYAKISNITWNYSDSENLSGYIANEDTKEFKSFHIPSSASAFDTANSLWDMIENNTA